MRKDWYWLIDKIKRERERERERGAKQERPNDRDRWCTETEIRKRENSIFRVKKWKFKG